MKAHRLVVILLVASALAGALEAAEPGVAKNIVLFLGDAGGLPTLNAASIYAHKAPQKLFVHRMPHIALADTSSAVEWVTDSAAGMTAIATGQKTRNGVLAQSSAAVRGKKDGEPLKTILEYAEERGLSTGVVSNSSVLSATPATLYAHVNDRKDEAGIFRQLLAPRFGDGVDVVIGAGRKNVIEAAKLCGVEAKAAMEKAGLRWYEKLDAVPSGARRAVVLFAGPFDLEAATRAAVDVLSRNPRGFFLMVESDLHTEELLRGLDHTMQLDRSMRHVAGRLGSDTLVMFTADHSYDFRIHDGDKDKSLLPPGTPAEFGDDQDSVRLENVRRDDDHTAEEVLVAAQGPGAERVRGFLSNTDLFHIMLAAFAWK
jgi:alkaline phosphatase